MPCAFLAEKQTFDRRSVESDNCGSLSAQHDWVNLLQRGDLLLLLYAELRSPPVGGGLGVRMGDLGATAIELFDTHKHYVSTCVPVRMGTHPDGDHSGKRMVGSVANACRILNVLYDHGGGRVTEVAEELDLNKGTVHTQLSTLREYGYVHKSDNVYFPSMRFLEIGEGVKTEMEIFRAAEDELKELANTTGEYAHLMIEQNGWGYIIHKEKGDRAATTTSRVGKKLHLHYTSTGKSILAHLPPERVDMIVDRHGLPKRTERTITSKEALEEELDEIRESGTAYDRGEQINGARCVGAPIQEPDGTVLGAISVSGPESRVSGDFYREELPNLVSSAANVIEMNIEVDRLNQ